MKIIRLLIIGVLLAASSGCFPIFVPEGGRGGGHDGGHEEHGGGGRGGEHGERH